jgi:hypothetical protein
MRPSSGIAAIRPYPVSEISGMTSSATRTPKYLKMRETTNSWIRTVTMFTAAKNPP